ncbi:hypothetical protein B0G71_2564 [Paraburkholderia sp. BL27I4N3]|uniref:hypothetical protein n=1 Tax=Paraburkholderia sp. BL27I4N3 TaxID=1938805 RepID=UPI000E252A84|nr:hypothetical protein [Paraburkholderia sp. BL27I4N3]REE19467.1 hypothetical protein B0G71_2564 [Paraburkholderia sp. BL27I4N3]
MSINFSLDSDGGVVVQQGQAASGSSTTFNGGVSGGSQSSGNIAQGGTDINAFANAERAQGVFGSGVSLDSFNKLTQGMIQPYIDRAKKEQYADGMAQAAQGKSLISIENDQPWYTKIYGPDASVQGAQMFNVNAAMNDAQTSFMQAMPQLRERLPDQVRSYLVDKMSQVQSTGDQYTDAMVQQKLSEQLPQMLNQHMQQYSQFTQEQNYLGFTNMGTSAARSMQATLAASPDNSDEEIAKAHASYTANLAKPDNMTTEAYQRGLKDITVSNAMTGNWQAVRAVKQMPEFQQLDPEIRAQLDDKIPLLEAQAAAKNPEYAQSLDNAATLEFAITKGGGAFPTSPAGHAAAMQKMEDVNAAYKAQWGDATVPFPPAKQKQVLEQMDANNQRQHLAALKAQNRQLNYNEAATLVQTKWAADRPEDLKGIPIPEGAQVTALNAVYQDATAAGPDSPQANTFWQHASANARDPQMHPQMLDGYIKSTLGSFFDGAGPATPQQMNVVDMAQKLRSGPGGVDAVKSYFGDHAEATLAILDSGANISDPQQFDMIRTQWQRGKLATASAQDKKDALDYVTRQDTAWWNPFRKGDLSGWDISDGAKQQLAQQVAPLMAQKQRAFGLSPDDAARAAYTQVMGNADLVPGTVVPEDKGKWGKGQGWMDYVGKVPGAVSSQNSALYQDTMRSYINELATDSVKAAGGDMSNFKPDDYKVQYGQYLGGGLMHLYLSKGDGAFLPVTMKADDFGKRVSDAVQSHSYGANGSKAPQGMPEKNAFGWGY